MEETAKKWLAVALPPAHRIYIQDRMVRYRAVVKEMQRQEIGGEVHRSLLLWNHGLLFETHELLEAVWQAAAGERREALKGLIQAAGAFVHAAHGNRPAASRLGLRAQTHLKAHGRHLAGISNLQELIRALSCPAPVPPQLVSSMPADIEKRSDR
jgi:predicted metal-dependent hydrolase